MTENGSTTVLWRSGLGAEQARAEGLPEPFDLRVDTDAGSAEAHADWAEILVDGSPPERLLDGARLRHVIVPYAGVNDALREAVRARPHLALHNSHFNAAFVAQHAVALLLACADRIPEADRALRRGDWSPRYDDGFLTRFLGGRRCLLLGYGAIGREIAPRARGLGMEVAAYSRTRPSDPDLRWHGPDGLEDALAEADAVLASLPATPATAGLLDERAFAALRPEAILVNVGRGEVIDQHALYRALAEGRLRAAGLDVWWRYPESPEDRARTFPSDAPLHELRTVVMSPHRANQTEAWKEASFRDVTVTLRSLAAGGGRNRVDVDLGY